MIFRYYSNPDWGHRTTVVGQLNGEDLKIAVATTNDGENFVKKIGRAIAEGRLAKNKLHAIINVQEHLKAGKLMSESFVAIAEKVAKKRINEIEFRKETKHGKN